MTVLMEQLEAAMREPSSAPRWIIAPTRIIGQQWLDRVTMAGGFTLNVHVKTLRSIALDLAAPAIVEGGLAMLGQHTGTAIVSEAWSQATEQLSGDEHFRRLSVTPGLVNAWWRLVDELRDANLSPDDVKSRLRSHHAAKASEISALLHAYESLLETHRLIDHAGLTRLAINALESTPLENELEVFIPRSITERRSERRLLDRMGSARLVWVDDDPMTAMKNAKDPECDADLLRYIAKPASAPSPKRDGSVQFVAAMGERNEVRATLRRILNRDDVRSDDVELLYSDRDTYASVVYEVVTALNEEDDGDEGDETGGELRNFKVTFADGIPVSLTRVGQALAGWISWQQSGFRQHELLRLIRAGLLRIPSGIADETQTPVSRPKLVTHLSSVTIRQGRSQYLPALDAQIKSQQGRASAGSGDLDAAEQEARRERIERSIEELKVVRSFIDRLLACTQADLTDVDATLDGARCLLAEFVGSHTGMDGRARKSLIQAIDSMRLVVQRTSLQSEFDPLVWLGSMLGDLRVDATGPRPGAIHVANILGGGHSGRRLAILVGMDDARVAVRLAEDPMLLDDDRTLLAGSLPSAAERQRQRRDAWHQSLARLDAREVWMSCPRWDIIDQRELFPSMLMLQTYRIVCGDAETDLSHLLRAMPAIAGCGADSHDEVTLDSTEWWIRTLCEPGTPNHWPGILETHATQLASGQRAEAARNDPSVFTEWDGRVPDAGPAMDLTRTGARAVSSSTLELIARCPMDFFFKKGLYIASTDDQTMNPDRWLDPLDFGTMMHDVFRRFVQHLIDHEEHANVDLHRSLLRDMLVHELTIWQSLVPPPTEYAYRRQRREAEAMTHVLLLEEAEYHKGTPRFVEASCGTPLDDEAAPIARVEPVPLNLPGNRVLHLSGRIDRIDEVGPHEYYIWDYKTGRYWDKKFLSKDPYDAGRLLQHAVYIHLANAMLKTHDPDARVVGAGYIYPRLDGARRVFASSELLTNLPITIGHLVDIVATGAFLPGCEFGDYGISDYKAVHGDRKHTAQRYNAKLTGSSDPLLTPMRRLRGVQA